MDAAANNPAEHRDNSARVTPMMEQYVEIKAAHPDSLLFYRMGDFYELFFRDAETASRDLGIVLTKRGKHLGEDIPMCGVPVERADEYLHRLIALGHRVAVCEQTEDPAEAKKRGAKSVVRRAVTRLVTPGTLTEDSLLDARRNNYLAAVARMRGSAAGDTHAIAWIDISTGEFCVAEHDRVGLQSEIARLAPGEIIVSDALYEEADWAPYWRDLKSVSPLGRDVFDGATAERRLADYFHVATTAGFGPLSRAELTAAAACITYVERTQLGQRLPLSPPSREGAGSVLAIDAATRANLELVATLSGERQGSLLATIDRTVTSAGGRMLAQRLSAPLTDVAAIARRHDAVAAFADDAAARRNLREALRACPDFARSLSRLAVGRGGPRDLAAIRDGLAAADRLRVALEGWSGSVAETRDAAQALAAADQSVAAELAAALADDLPLMKRDGGFVRAGYAAALDEVRALRDESRRVIAGLQARYADEAGVKALKIRHNNVLAYFVEVTAQHAERMLSAPLNQTFIHRQTLAGQVRFTTTALGELEAKISTAGARALALELEIFDRLAARVVAASDPIKAAAAALSGLDVAAGLADLAVTHRYVRPEIAPDLSFAIAGGRHPVVEQALTREGGPFVANDCDLSPIDLARDASGKPISTFPHPARAASPGRIWLVTGPNMAGKSTFLRQNALIVILAQMGGFVPAASARIGVVDRLFSRVGAADDLARGRSTFMVEMVETAAILNQAGERSLVILDEIGRGTATFDGLSIAWAAIEHLHEVNRSRALFATHYHELTALGRRLPRLHNVTVRVKEWQGDVVFLHEVVAGAADRSYGVQVAKLAGLPGAVIDKAKIVLAQLEAEDRMSPARRLIDDLPLFAAARPPEPAGDPAAAALARALDELNPDDLSPREALEALYALKAKAAKK